jgi:thiamine transport system substrate-binding protein
MMRNRLIAITALTALALTACGTTGSETPQTLSLIAHESFAGSTDESTFAAFTEETGIEVEVLSSEDAGTLVNEAALTKGNPLADVLFGVDDTFLSRALDEEIFEPFEPANIDVVYPDLRVEGDPVVPIDYGDVCFNYDKAWFEESALGIPDELEDMTDPEIARLVTVEHPATSSPGLAFMLATVDTFGEPGWLDWWSAMRDGGIDTAPDWDSAYYGKFTRYGGDRPIVLSYASSPPAEVIFADEPLDEAPTGVIEAGCYRQVEYAGVLAGTEYPEAAGQLIEFMLAPEFQETIPLTWFVFPANQEVQLPQEFVEHTTIPESPTRLGYDVIAENRDRWIDEWIEVMEG